MKKRGFEPISMALIGCGCLGFMLLGLAGLTALGFFAMNSEDSGTYSGIEVDDGRQDITKEEWTQIFKAAGSALNMPWELGAAILYSETGGGVNFGGCSYFPEAPASGWVLNSSQVRNETDRTTFESIVNGLLYPKNKPVSCNAGGANGTQNGGAMGYMQIMPPEWQGAADKVVENGITSKKLNPWNAQDAAYVGSQVIRNKAKVPKISDPFPLDEASIKMTISLYLGGEDTTRPYVTKTYARYLEIKAAGVIP
ncbi:MAG: hypothetical protein PHT36_01530 [Patescibacteria group bacterium]|nr:hypothetical protein [Patescibacteria group bacterium]